MKIQGLTMSEYLEQITKPTGKVIWSKATPETETFIPYLCKNTLGDGLQIIYFGIMDQRPFYWLLRIDSATDIKSEDFDIDPIFDLIGEECGHFFGWDDDYDEEEDCYPMIRLDGCGYHCGLEANFKTGDHQFSARLERLRLKDTNTDELEAEKAKIKALKGEIKGLWGDVFGQP